MRNLEISEIISCKLIHPRHKIKWKIYGFLNSPVFTPLQWKKGFVSVIKENGQRCKWFQIEETQENNKLWLVGSELYIVTG